MTLPVFWDWLRPSPLGCWGWRSLGSTDYCRFVSITFHWAVIFCRGVRGFLSVLLLLLLLLFGAVGLGFALSDILRILPRPSTTTSLLRSRRVFFLAASRRIFFLAGSRGIFLLAASRRILFLAGPAMLWLASTMWTLVAVLALTFRSAALETLLRFTSLPFASLGMASTYSTFLFGNCLQKPAKSE